VGRTKRGFKQEPSSKNSPWWKRLWRWTEFGKKTGWQWLELLSALAIPVVLTVAGFWFAGQQAVREEKRAELERELEEERAQDEALQAYLDQMNNLLLEHNLRTSKEDSGVRTLARARTLTVLGRLDPSRKTEVMQVLVEAELVQSVEGRGPLIRLGGANLSDVNLNDADLSRVVLSDANLSGVVLSDADLSGANLSNANLSGANLSGANLSGAKVSNASVNRANLSWTDLSDADLSYTILSNADLSYANLSEANLFSANLGEANLSFAVLSDATSLFDATLSGADLSGAKVSRADLRSIEDLEKQPWAPEARPPKPGDIFHDDFSSTSTNWPRGEFQKNTGTYYVVEYFHGLYRMYSPPPSSWVTVWNNRSGTQEDVIVEVDAQVRGDAPYGRDGWGVICRFQDSENFYLLGIGPAGSSYIYKRENSKWQSLDLNSKDDAIRGGKKKNHLRADCLGHKLTLFVNGHKVVEAEDSTFDSGVTGLYMEDHGDHKFDVLFDNFLVSRP
jgi:uncharacterized protein YjbI with pentapeptide repeats